MSSSIETNKKDPRLCLVSADSLVLIKVPNQIKVQRMKRNVLTAKEYFSRLEAS